jgi:Pentapeptide repeats (8 copies)
VAHPPSAPYDLAKAPDTGRHEVKDKAVRSDVFGVVLSNIEFVRLVAKKRRFTNVDFKYSTFDTCYLRDSTFDTCDFTGCRFVSTNAHGATFSGCKFDYAIFERTLIDDHILDQCCPAYENLKLRFARSLRINYHQIGDAAAANKAIGVELAASAQHLLKAWRSTESYYRYKYRGAARITVFIKWILFKLLDFIWGNGESYLKLLRFVVLLMFGIVILDVSSTDQMLSLAVLVDAVCRAPQIFFGVTTPNHFSAGWLTLVTVLRLTTFGLFMSIIIKRLNYR